MYEQGTPELAAKETAEIAVIEASCRGRWTTRRPRRRRERDRRSGCLQHQGHGKVMAALRAKHAAALDMAKADRS